MDDFSGRIHITIGVVIWIFFPNLHLIALAIGSLFPDCDHRNAAMGKVLPLWLIGFKHRGLTHTIWLAIFFSLIVEYYFNNLGISFFIGYVSHLIGDKLSSK